MKKIFSLLACLVTVMVCLSLSSCSKDDDNDNSSSIVGCWLHDESGTSSLKLYFIFRGNGDFYEYVRYSNGTHAAVKGTYRYSGTTLSLTYSEETVSGKAVVNGNKLITYDTTDDGEEYTDTFSKTSQPITDTELEELCKLNN